MEDECGKSDPGLGRLSGLEASTGFSLASIMVGKGRGGTSSGSLNALADLLLTGRLGEGRGGGGISMVDIGVRGVDASEPALLSERVSPIGNSRRGGISNPLVAKSEQSIADRGREDEAPVPVAKSNAGVG